MMLALDHFEQERIGTAEALKQVEARQAKGMLGDESHLIAHLRRNLEYFTVRANAIKALIAVKRGVDDLIRNLEREADFIHELAPQRALLLRVAGQLGALSK